VIVAVLALFGQDPGPKERLHPAQHAFVPDPFSHPAHQGRVVDLVEARLDVRLEHPLIVAGGCGEVMDLGDSVLGPAPRAEAVGTRLEVRLEDRLEHQFHAGLHDTVHGRGDPQPPDLARRLRDRLLPHPFRGEPPGLQIFPQSGQHALSTRADRGGNHPVDPGRACALVAPHPVPRHHEERRVIDEVGQIIEATARIGLRPSVQLDLHSQYPQLGLFRLRPRSADIHQRPPANALTLRTRWTPSPCGRLSRPRTTTGPPSHPGGISRRRTFPPDSWTLTGSGTAGVVPTFTPEPFDRVGAQLCPCSIATATPQFFTVASRSATSPDPGVPRPRPEVPACGCALLTSPDPPGWSWRLS